MAPATAAKLGCAFDCGALALNRYHKLRAEQSSEPGFQVSCHGPNREYIPEDESNLGVRAIRRLAEWAGVELPGWRIDIDNEIPVSAGLGSSAAAVVAGLLLGARICGVRWDRIPLLRLALEFEGHADNAAAAYLGGLVFSIPREDRPDVPHTTTSATTQSDRRRSAFCERLDRLGYKARPRGG